MRKRLSASLLLCGLVLLVDVGAMLVHFARVLAPFGGIPWSWSLIGNNPVWVLKAVAGLLLLLSGLVLLLRSFRAPSALSPPLDRL